MASYFLIEKGFEFQLQLAFSVVVSGLKPELKTYTYHLFTDCNTSL
jgi:hypothetical protein